MTTIQITILILLILLTLAFPSKYKVLEVKIFKNKKYQESNFHVFRLYAFILKSYITETHQGEGISKTTFNSLKEATNFAQKENTTKTKTYKKIHNI